MSLSLHADLCEKYAQAYLNVFGADLTLLDAENFMRAYQFLHAHHKITFFLKLSALDDETKTKQITLLCEKFSLPKSVDNVIQLLLEHKRASLFEHILYRISTLYKERAGIHDFVIKSAVALSDQEKDQIQELLARTTGHDNIYTYHVDTRLIAGVRLQSHTLLWEHSIAQQLRQLELSLVAKGN
jgi:ATP synthase F1 delta subunit